MEALQASDFHHREIIVDHSDALNSDQIKRSDLHRMAAIVRDLEDARRAIAITRSPSNGGTNSRKNSTITVRSNRDRGAFREIVEHDRFEG